MNIIYKYKLNINLTDQPATNDTGITGYAIGGTYEGAISSYSSTGTAATIAVGVGVGLVPTTQASYEQVMETSKVYDILFSNATVVPNQPHVYKIPLSILGADDINQKVNSINFLNIYDPIAGDIFPLTDRFFYKYDFDKRAIFFGFPSADINAYAGYGLKLHLSFISTKI